MKSLHVFILKTVLGVCWHSWASIHLGKVLNFLNLRFLCFSKLYPLAISHQPFSNSLKCFMESSMDLSNNENIPEHRFVSVLTLSCSPVVFPNGLMPVPEGTCLPSDP